MTEEEFQRRVVLVFTEQGQVFQIRMEMDDMDEIRLTVVS